MTILKTAASLEPMDVQKVGTRNIAGNTTLGVFQETTAEVYLVKYKTASVEVLYCLWPDKSVDIRASEVHSGQPAVGTLSRGRLRLGVKVCEDDSQLCWSELRVAKIKPVSDNWSNLAQVSVTELKKAAGFDVASYLGNLPEVQSVGTKEFVLGRKDTTRNRLCAKFNVNKPDLAVRIFAATRVAPLENGYC